MKIRSLSFLCLMFLLSFGKMVAAQSSLSAVLQKNHDYSGAVAKKAQYRAAYQIDTKDPAIINKALRNINNALDDPRLKGKLQVEVVAFSDGVALYLKTSPYEKALKDLVERGVLVVQCANTLREKHIDRSQIFDFVGVVPSGNGELIIRQAEGWSIIKP